MNQVEKKKHQFIVLPKTGYRHLYSLQNLHSDKLVRTVNKVLKKEFVLVK
jgi:hypothetical protein